MIRKLISVLALALVVFGTAASAQNTIPIPDQSFAIFGGGGTNLNLWKEASSYKWKAVLGFTGGLAYQIAPRWSTYLVYDYSERTTEPTTSYTPVAGRPKVAVATVTPAEKIFVNEVQGMTGFLLNSTTSALQFKLLAGLQITDGSVPSFGTYLGFVNGGLITYQFKKGNGLKAFGAGTITLGEDYQTVKLRFGLAYPVL